MKGFFLFFCFLNVAFFFWELNRHSSTPPVPRTSNLPEILLVSEVEKARSDAQLSVYLDADLDKLEHARLFTPEQNPVLAPLAGKSSHVHPTALPRIPAQTVPGCYELGPFADAKAIQNWLGSQGLTGEIFDRLAFIPASYMVYYPTDKDPEKLRLQKMMLAAKGVKDFWVVPSGELKGMLSLGVFNDALRAESMRSSLARIGVKAEIAHRKKSEPSLFVRIRSVRQIHGQFGGIPAVNCKSAKSFKK